LKPFERSSRLGLGLSAGCLFLSFTSSFLS
jgi:hypothetical protein